MRILAIKDLQIFKKFHTHAHVHPRAQDAHTFLLPLSVMQILSMLLAPSVGQDRLRLYQVH